VFNETLVTEAAVLQITYNNETLMTEAAVLQITYNNDEHLKLPIFGQ
jgi:hypothetical protein